MTTEEARVLASEARHGAETLRRLLRDALERGRVRLEVPGMPVWLDAETVRLALAGEHPVVETGNALEPTLRAVSPSDAWDAIDSRLGSASSERWSTHVGRLRARGRDMSRPELLDEAVRWPAILAALGMPVGLTPAEQRAVEAHLERVAREWDR